MKNLKKEKLYIQVFDEIRKYIVRNKILPGEKLPTEHEMCDMLGVSRNALREAIKALEIIGVIKSRPGIGIVVQEFNMDFLFQNMFLYLVSDSAELIKEILEIRKVLELGFVKQAFDLITEVEIKELEILIKKMEEKESKNELYFEEDMDFHMTIFKNVGSKTLTSIFEAAWNVDLGFDFEKEVVYKTYKGGFLTNHIRIFQALKDRDFEMFKKEMEKHFSSGSFMED